ncbi:MAG: bacillithiol system redox-active protein YtxJ [Aquaticitalea sp.]
MGLFDKIFSNSNEQKEEKTTPFIDLDTIDQLDAIIAKSTDKPQLLFKHSTRCGISRMVINQFKKYYNLTNDQADLYYLDLLNHRNISAEIANRFHVVHESPQLIVIKNGAVVKHASHGEINNLVLTDLV